MRKTGPEKQVEKEIMSYAKRIGLDLTIVDTSAVYSYEAKRYVRAMASESLPDLIGNWNSIAVFIELKAKGKRSAINSKACRHQLLFLIRKINSGCFACVTDSKEHLHNLFIKFSDAKDISERRFILMSDLPKNQEQLALERMTKKQE